MTLYQAKKNDEANIFAMINVGIKSEVLSINKYNMKINWMRDSWLNHENLNELRKY